MVDEIGFVPLHKDAAELLFQVISDCYERKSLIITSNLEFSQWNTVFGDNRLTAALVCYTFTLTNTIHKYAPAGAVQQGRIPFYPSIMMTFFSGSFFSSFFGIFRLSTPCSSFAPISASVSASPT